VTLYLTRSAGIPAEAGWGKSTEQRQKALAGQELGDLGSLIAKLRRSGRKLVYLSLPRLRIVSSQEFDPD